LAARRVTAVFAAYPTSDSDILIPGLARHGARHPSQSVIPSLKQRKLLGRWCSGEVVNATVDRTSGVNLSDATH